MKFKSDSELATLANSLFIFLFNGADDAKYAPLCDGCEIKAMLREYISCKLMLPNPSVVIKGLLDRYPPFKRNSGRYVAYCLRIIPEGGRFRCRFSFCRAILPAYTPNGPSDDKV